MSEATIKTEVKNMRFRIVLIAAFVSAAAVALLAACACSEPAQTAVEEGSSDTYTSAVLATSYEGALSASNQLMLGTLLLEGTEHAVTPEQAKTLLPLWQALQGGVTAQAEVNAVLKQIEGTMTQEQLQAIAAMQLTQEDLQAWMEENNIRPGGVFTGTMQWQGGTPGPGGAPPAGSGGGPPGGGTVSPDMATRRAEFANMSDAEREAIRATMQAGGGMPGGAGGGPGGPGGRGGSSGGFGMLLRPLIVLLEERAG
jgi:hypothetical protein